MAHNLQPPEWDDALPADTDAPPLDEAAVSAKVPIGTLTNAPATPPKRRLNLTPPSVEPAPRVTAQISSDLYSLDAEESVLGCVLISPDEAYFAIVPFIKPEDFYFAKNRWVWEAFTRLHDCGTPIDLLTVSEELARHNHLEDIGGPSQLSHLLNVVPTSLHAEAYGRIVQRDAMRRRLLDAATKVAKLAYVEDRDIVEVISEAEGLIMAVGDGQTQTHQQPFAADMDAEYARAQRVLAGETDPLGVPTGIIDLDNLLGGLQKSDLILVAGRPGTGKTSLITGIAKHAAQKHGKRVALFSLEMARGQIVLRLVSQETGLDMQDLKFTRRLREADLPLYAAAVQRMQTWTLVIDDTPSLSPIQLRAACKRLQIEQGLDLVLVDYLQIMSTTGAGLRFGNRQEEVTYIARQLKILARELNVPIVAGAQLSRGLEQRTSKRPVLSDLRESGALEQEADIVVFIHREGEAVPAAVDPRELVVAKQRNGPTGDVPVVFRRASTSFENAYRGA